DADGLFAVFEVADGVEEAEGGVLLWVEAVERGGGKEGLQAIAAFDTLDEQRHVGSAGQRRVLERAIDFRLEEQRFVLVGAAGRGEEVELVAVAAGPVESAIAASVEPERDAVGAAGTVGAALWRGFLAANFDLQGDTARIPCEANVREVREPVGGREIV